MNDPQSGYVTLEWQQWLQNPEFVTVKIDTPLPVSSGGTGQVTSVQSELQMAGPMYPATEMQAAQVTVSLYAGTGAPNNAGGMNGDFYFRADGAALTTVYQKRAGIWTGIV